MGSKLPTATVNACGVLRCAAFAALACAASPLAAQDGLTSHFAIDDADPEASVPTAQQALQAPLQMGYWTMLVAERGDAAMKKGEHAVAARYFRALVKAVPDRSVGYARLCSAYRAASDFANALTSCKAALGTAGVTLEDHARFVRLLLDERGELAREEVADADAVIAHAAQALPRDAKARAIAIAQLRCELGLRLEDASRLQACTRALGTLAPKDPLTLAFRWSLALLERDFAQAERLLDAAREAKLPAEALAGMERRMQVEHERMPWLEALRQPRALLGLAALAVTVALALMLFARRRGLRRRGGLAQPA